MGMGGGKEGSCLRTNWVCKTNPFKSAGWRKGRPELTQKAAQKPMIVEPGIPLCVDTVCILRRPHQGPRNLFLWVT